VIFVRFNSKTKAQRYNPQIKIPTQLEEFPGARFILIDKTEGKGKKPKERKWTTENNYDSKHPRLYGHIRCSRNYGIATGFGWLQCIDVDEEERLRELGILDKLPPTLTVKTGGGGLHYWYKIVGLKKRMILYDPEVRDTENEDQYLHLGEIQSMGNYAIGPNCIHNSGNRYEIINDVPIAEIDYQLLLDIIKPLRTKKKDERPATVPRCSEEKHSLAEVELSRIAWPEGNVQKINGSNGVDYRGANPFHGSRTGHNFSVNPSKGVWYCFRCESGGGWMELLAVKERIITCSQAGPGCLSKKQRREVFQRAEELGLIREKVVDAPIKEIALAIEELESIPQRIPDGDMIVLMAPPRTGKTQAVVQWLKDSGNGNYITHNHAIVEHAIKIAKELGMTSIVWMIGINQQDACIHSKKQDCSKCPLAHTKENHFDLEMKTIKLLKEKKILTAKDVPRDMCPYFVLKLAEKHARYCFTVVNNINCIIPRKLTILDEEPVLSYFYATPIKIGSIQKSDGIDGYKNFIKKSNSLQFDLDQILNHGKKPALKGYAKIIQAISNILDQGRDSQWTAEKLGAEIGKILAKFNPKHRESEPKGDQSNGDELSLESCVRCLGYLFKENPVSVIKENGGIQSIYILGDERQTRYAMDWMNYTNKVVIIGATRAEIFASEFHGRKLVIDKFRYDDRFLLVGVDKTKKEDGSETARGAKQAQKKKIIDIANAIWENSETQERMPFLILTGSKREQERAAKKIQGATKLMIEREGGMEGEYINGKPAVFFQNSVISRGLDVDQYNLILVYGCDFAQPFWKVADPKIADEIISDETTNSVLRISSTLRNDNETLKVVVMPKEDLDKVKYLTDKIDMTEDPSKIAMILKKLAVGGKTVREGRNGLKVIGRGINFEKGKAKFKEIRSEDSEILDEEEKNSVMARIMSFMKESKRDRIGLRNSGKIYKNIKTRSGKNMVISAMQQLYAEGRLKMETHGKEKIWSLNEAKIT
jgi:hypothetical protein